MRIDLAEALFNAALVGGSGGGVTPSGTLSISANGTYDVTSFANADVYVSGSGPTLTDFIDGNISGVISDPAVSIIRGGAFMNCSKLTEVHFTHNSVNATTGVALGRYAFSGCSSLTTADIPYLRKVADWMFSDCYNLGSVSFPVCSTVYQYGFASCYRMETAYLPSATISGKAIFAYCSALKSIDLPANTSSVIGQSCFYSCQNLSKATIAGVTSKIELEGFFNCVKLESIEFSAVKHLAERVFYQCYALSSVSMPSLLQIGSQCFTSCSSINSLYFPSVTSIAASAFMNCGGLISFSAPVLTSIATSAFMYCTNLQDLSIPMTKTISAGAFKGCYLLRSVSLPNCSAISASVFDNCSRLLSVYFLGSSAISFTSPVTIFANTPISDNTAYTSGVHGSIYVPESLYTTYTVKLPSYVDRIVSLTDAQISALG